jgi:hypothetical protein
LVTFFAQAKKVTRSPARASGSLALERTTKSKELDSGLRRNDEQKRKELGAKNTIPTQPSP